MGCVCVVIHNTHHHIGHSGAAYQIIYHMIWMLIDGVCVCVCVYVSSSLATERYRQGEGYNHLAVQCTCSFMCPHKSILLVYFLYLQIYKGRHTARPRYHLKVIYPGGML